MSGAVRRMGSGGLFGCLGQFHSPAPGEFRMHTTRRSNWVGLGTAQRLVVISPDLANAFTAQVLTSMRALKPAQ
jgi:hypothetical protein